MSVLFLWMGTSESRVYENMENSETESTFDEFQPLITKSPESHTKLKKLMYLVLSVFVVIAIIGGIIGIYLKCTELSPYEKLMKEIAEAGDKLVVIYFGATWCQPCNQMIPKVKELSKEEPNVVFLYVSTDKDEEAAE